MDVIRPKLEGAPRALEILGYEPRISMDAADQTRHGRVWFDIGGAARDDASRLSACSQTA